MPDLGGTCGEHQARLRAIYTVFVRESRHTKALLDKNPEFTVNIPWGEVDKAILSLCGTRSGRDIDKIAQLGLTLEAPEEISVPAIRELPLTLELSAVFVLVGIPNVTYFRPEVNLNLTPFKGMMQDLKHGILNVILFVPLGFLLPVLWQNFRRMGGLCCLWFGPFSGHRADADADLPGYGRE